MTAIARMPLAAAAGITLACALAALAQPLLGALLGCVVASSAAALAIASSDRARQVLWGSVALAAAGSAARVFVDPPALAAADVAQGLRGALAAPIRALVGEPEGGIVLGIVLGERASIPRDLSDAFAATGTAHLLAISGSNMTLVASAIAFALRRRAPAAVVASATVCAVASYSVLVGLGPSVARAALMAAVTSLGLALGRGAAAANGLGAAVTAMLLADPAAVSDVGFQLSVAATAGLIAWQRPLAQRFSALPRGPAEALAATLAASVPTLPIVAAAFGRISLISPVANLLAVPLFAPVMLFGGATAAIGAVMPAVAWPVALAAYASAFALRGVVEIAARVPLASVPVPAGPVGGLAAAAIAIVLAVAGSRVRAPSLAIPAIAWPRLDRPRAAHLGSFALALGVVVSSAAAAATLSRAGGARLFALDIGQGDAYLLESDGRYALIDGGPDPNLLLRRLGEVLPPWQRRIDLVVLTHEHVDHGAGLLGVVGRYEIGLAAEPAGMGDVPFVHLWADRLTAAQVPRRALRSGERIELGAMRIDVLAPDERRVEFASLALRVSSGSWAALFMGDTTDEAIADMLLDPAALRARVYVPPHHGATTAYADALVNAVRPEVALISAGLNNKYGHPTAPTLAALRSVPVYRTDLCGTVELHLDEPHFLARTAKAAVPPGRGGSVPGTAASR